MTMIYEPPAYPGTGQTPPASPWHGAEGPGGPGGPYGHGGGGQGPGLPGPGAGATASLWPPSPSWRALAPSSPC